MALITLKTKSKHKQALPLIQQTLNQLAEEVNNLQRMKTPFYNIKKIIESRQHLISAKEAYSFFLKLEELSLNNSTSNTMLNSMFDNRPRLEGDLYSTLEELVVCYSRY